MKYLRLQDFQKAYGYRQRSQMGSIETDRYGRTVAEVYVQDSESTAVNLNMQMLRDGYAWLYAQYVDNCPSKEQFAIAEQLAREEKLGVWNGSNIPPWEWRKTNK